MPSKKELLNAITVSKLKALAKENNISLKNEWLFGDEQLTRKTDIVERLSESKKITKKKIQAKLSAPKKTKGKTTTKTSSRTRLAQAQKTMILKSQNYECAKCKRDISKITPHYDHRIPLAMGGSNNITNIQALCGTCHTEKTKFDKLEISRARGR